MRAGRWAAALLSALLLMVGAAGAEVAAGSTVTGQVTQVDGSEITIQTGAPTMPEGEAPAMPEGEAPPDGEVPAMPEGEAPPDGEAPAMPEGEAAFESGESLRFSVTAATAIAVEGADGTSDGAVEDIAVGGMLRVVFGEDGTVASVTVLSAGMGPAPDGAPGEGAEVDNGTAATIIDQDGAYEAQTYVSTGDDENALRIDGATVELKGIRIDKSGGACSSTESGDFYGVNAGLLALGGAQVYISEATVSTAAQNGNGIFSYGQGTQVIVERSAVTTLADNSGGLQTAGGGATRAVDCTVQTSGASSAAIRSDRGGGTVEIEGGSYTTNGTGSPAVYSTADITVAGATLTATASEAVVVEGGNSVLLTDCTVSGNMTGTYAGDTDENIHNVMLYQSTSGDAQEGTALFSMTGGTLTANAGDMFYATNTQAEIELTGVTLNLAEGGKLLCVEGNSAARGWGVAGENGAQVRFTANAQALAGEVTVDAISTLEFALQGGSTFTGSINIVENAQGGEAAAEGVHVVVGEDCVWTLTGDCTISTLENSGAINFGDYTITLADGTVLRAQ